MNAVRIEHGAQQLICPFMYYRCSNSANHKKQICRRTKSKATGLAVSKAVAPALKAAEMTAHSRCVTTGPIMLLIKYPTSQ